MVDINGLTTGLVNSTSDVIGHRLYKIKGQSGQIPAVIKNRQGGAKPSFPYAVVDYSNMERMGYAQRDTYLDDNLDEVNEFDYNIRMILQINGGIDHDVHSICEELSARLFTTQGKRLINQYLNGAWLLSSSKILFFPTRLSSELEEAASFNLDLSIRHILVDETIDVIETVEVNGELFVNEDDTNPLDVNVIAP